MRIDVQWTLLGDEDELWSSSFCLYAYIHPVRDWLLYIGKADYTTVRRRLHGHHKRRVFRDIQQRYGVNAVRVFHGDLQTETGCRRTSALLADAESLLIMRLQPFGNICATRSRISRPGLRVRCAGCWPFRRATFYDA